MRCILESDKRPLHSRIFNFMAWTSFVDWNISKTFFSKHKQDIFAYQCSRWAIYGHVVTDTSLVSCYTQSRPVILIIAVGLSSNDIVWSIWPMSWSRRLMTFIVRQNRWEMDIIFQSNTNNDLTCLTFNSLPTDIMSKKLSY